MILGGLVVAIHIYIYILLLVCLYFEVLGIQHALFICCVHVVMLRTHHFV